MKREILFRAKFRQLVTNKEVWLESTVNHKIDTKGYAQLTNWMQYTGLTDKNGVKIFEGDIVKCVNGHIGVVQWESHDCTFNVSDYYNQSDDYPTMAFMEGQPFEVLSNIHGNTELLNQS